MEPVLWSRCLLLAALTAGFGWSVFLLSKGRPELFGRFELRLVLNPCQSSRLTHVRLVQLLHHDVEIELWPFSRAEVLLEGFGYFAS
jgi:hypothetical protein